MNEDNYYTDRTIKAQIDLYYDLHLPKEHSAPAPLLIAVHGYGAHKRYMMRESRLVAPEHFAIASVQAPHPHFRPTADGYRVGFGWLTDHRSDESIALHHHFLNTMIDELHREGSIDNTRVYLFGFSQACALNFRYAFTYPERAAAVVGVCGGIPGDLETNPNYKPYSGVVLYLYGDDDEFYSQEKFRGFDEALAGRLKNYRSIHYTAKHEITDEMRRDIRQFLSQLP